MTLQPRSQPLNINLNCLKASIREATPDIYAERTGSIFLMLRRPCSASSQSVLGLPWRCVLVG
jgi:hypothetical protein